MEGSWTREVIDARHGLWRELWSTVRVTDAVDIAVVAVLAYFVIRWLQRARSRFVLGGLAAMAGLYLVARLMGLQLTLYLFQTIVTVAAVALVVIFQEDIRRGFERLAARATPRAAVAPDAGLVDVLTSAVMSFSARRVGALIVLKGLDPLTRHLHGGEGLRGRVSVPLLDSIFDAGSAGHDGAVIVDNGVVTRFGVHLPLSNAISGGRALGTRHAAALGLAERCDATVIVVSEERGTVSVAHDGDLVPVHNAAELRRHIQSHLAHEREHARRKWYSFLFRNWGTKVLAVALAFGGWLLVFGADRPHVTRTVVAPVLHRSVAEGWRVDRPEPSQVKVTLTGPERVLRELEPGAVRVMAESEPREEGHQRIRLTPQHVEVPMGVSVLGIEPGWLGFEARRTKRVEARVDARTRGQLPAGLRLEDVSVEPRTVELVVIASEAERHTVIGTEPIDLTTANGPAERQVPLSIPEGAQLAPGEPAAVDVTLRVVGADAGAPAPPP